MPYLDTVRVPRLASIAAATLAMAAASACQLLLPFEETGASAQQDGGGEAGEAAADAPSADASADAGADALADVDACMADTWQPVQLAGGQPTPTCLRVYAGEVYWGTNSASGRSGVWHAPIDDGGAPRQLVAVQWISGLTVSSNGLYWADPSGIETYVDGGASTFVATTTAQMVTADDASVYWSDWGMGKPIYSQPLGVPAASPPSTPLFTGTGTAFGLIVQDGTLYWTENDTNTNDGLVLFGSIGGGQATTIATMQANPVGISVDDAMNVYWANTGTNGADAGAGDQAVRAQPSGGATPATLASGLKHPIAVWADPMGSYVYWVEQGSPQTGYADGLVARVSKTGPAIVKVLATGQGQPTDITGDDTSIYWANAGALVDGGTIENGQIMKLPK